MSPERSFSQRLRSVYANSSPSSEPTPNQIQRHTIEASRYVQAGEKVGITDNYLIAKVFFPKGRLIPDKLLAFSKSLERIKTEYGEEIVDQLTPECVKENGRINERKLRKVLKENRNS